MLISLLCCCVHVYNWIDNFFCSVLITQSPDDQVPMSFIGSLTASTSFAANDQAEARHDD